MYRRGSGVEGDERWKGRRQNCRRLFIRLLRYCSCQSRPSLRWRQPAEQQFLHRHGQPVPVPYSQSAARVHALGLSSRFWLPIQTCVRIELFYSNTSLCMYCMCVYVHVWNTGMLTCLFVKKLGIESPMFAPVENVCTVITIKPYRSNVHSVYVRWYICTCLLTFIKLCLWWISTWIVLVRCRFI